MIEGLPFYVTAVFFLTTIATVWLLLIASRPGGRDSLAGRIVFFAIPFWLVTTGFLAATGFYREFTALPPRVPAFAVLPAAAFVIFLFLFFRQSFIEKLSLKALTLLHIVRVPVELVLLWLYTAGQVPRQMTFEGWNFDILSGLTALIVYFFGFRGGRVNRTLLIVWNLAALLLLFNIVTIAVVSFPGPAQRIGFDQPNIGVTYLPFIWLPALIVPIVLFAHLSSLWQLIFASKPQD